MNYDRLPFIYRLWVSDEVEIRIMLGIHIQYETNHAAIYYALYRQVNGERVAIIWTISVTLPSQE